MPRDEDDDRPLFEGRNPADEDEPGPESRRRSRREEEEDYEEERPRRRRREGDATGGLIPYKNGKALAAYYTGVFGLIPCIGGILGPIAVVLGFLGLSHASRFPESKGRAHAIVGIVLGLLETVAYLLGPILFVVIMGLTKR